MGFFSTVAGKHINSIVTPPFSQYYQERTQVGGTGAKEIIDDPIPFCWSSYPFQDQAQPRSTHEYQDVFSPVAALAALQFFEAADSNGSRKVAEWPWDDDGGWFSVVHRATTIH